MLFSFFPFFEFIILFLISWDDCLANWFLAFLFLQIYAYKDKISY